MSDSRPAAQTHERRLSVLAQLVLLGALRDVLARLERARFATARTVGALAQRSAVIDRAAGTLTGRRTTTSRVSLARGSIESELRGGSGAVEVMREATEQSSDG